MPERGMLSTLGVYGVMDKFPVGVMMNKSLTVRTAQQHGQKYVTRLLEHTARGELHASFLTTHRFPSKKGSVHTNLQRERTRLPAGRVHTTGIAPSTVRARPRATTSFAQARTRISTQFSHEQSHIPT